MRNGRVLVNGAEAKQTALHKQKKAKQNDLHKQSKHSSKKKNKTKVLSERFKNSHEPTWFKGPLDLTRDRKPACKSRPKRGNLGNARKYCLDQKMARLELQSGTSNSLDFVFDLKETVTSFVKDKYATLSLEYIECTFLFICDMLRVQNLMDVFLAVVHFVKHYTKKPLLCSEHLQNVQLMLDIPILQSGEREFLDGFKSLLRDWSRVQTSPLLKKITQILVYATSVGFYKGPIPSDAIEKVKKVQEVYHTSRLSYTTDFVYYILDLIHFICDKSYSILFEGKDAKSIFVSNMEYDIWLEKAQNHLSKAEFLSNPTAFNLDLHEYLYTLRDLIRMGNEIYKYSCELDKTLRNLVRKTTFNLQKVEMKMMSRESAQAMRPVPFAIAIEGDSSVGKSKVAESIHYYFASLFNKPVTGCEKYTKSATAKFWDGFTSDQWSLFMDDVGMWSSDLDLVDESVMDIVRIINNMPYMPDMASLEDKGQTPFKGELVVITTNIPDLKCNEYFTYPFAASRRVPYHIRVRPKKVTEKFMIDSSKTQLEPGMIPDDWFFDIFKPVPKDFGNPREGTIMKQAVMESVAKDLTMGDLLAFIKIKATEHRAHQSRVVEHSMSLKRVKLCDMCKLPNNFCSCVEPQLGIETLAMGTCNYFFSYICTRILDGFICWGIFPILCSNLQLNFERYLKIRLRELKNRVHENYVEHKSKMKPVACVCGLFLLIGLILKIYKATIFVKKQGADFSKWGDTITGKGEKENVWVKESYPIDSFDSTPQCLSMKGLMHSQIEEVIFKNCAYLRFKQGAEWKFCRLLNLKGQKFITPDHCIPNVDSLYCQIIRGTVRDHVGDQHYFTLCPSQIERYPEKDLCLLTIPSVANGKDITQLFVKEKALHKGPIKMICRNKDGSIKRYESDYSEPSSLQTILKDCEDFPIWKTDGLHTESGDCGSVLYRIDDMGVRLLGIHESLLNTECFPFCNPTPVACSITLTYEFVSTLPLSKEVGVTVPQLGIDGIEPELKPMAACSSLRCVDCGTFKYYGQVRPTNRPRSKVKETILCDTMKQLGFPLVYGPPITTSLKPWMINVRKQVCADTLASWDDLMIVKKHILAKWLTISDEYKSEIKILDFDTVINGVPGLKYVDAIPRKTSAGFPYCKSKANYMYSIEGPQGTDKVNFVDEIMDKVNWRLEHYDKSERTFPVYRGSLKDEATSLEKISNSKTRVFMGAPLDFTIPVRCLLLSFVRVVQKNKSIFEAAPGLEAQSKEWDGLYHYITRYGENQIVCGDFSGFDSTMRSNFLRAAFDLIEDFHAACGATDQHLRMLRSLSYDIIFPLVEFNGDLVEFNGKNPSGQPLTTILNCIINSMYIHYSYLKLNPDKTLDDYYDNVSLMTYGDDNIFGVSNKKKWFNHTSVSNVLGTIGVTYTMADKKTDSIPYIHISEADFLKRKWRYEPETCTMLCPLAEDSIVKSLMIGIKSKNICEKEHAANIILSAHGEFFWHGKIMFTRWDEILHTFVEDFNLHRYLPRELPKWEDYVNEYFDRSKDFITFQSGNEDGNLTTCLHCDWEKSCIPYSFCELCKKPDLCMICGYLARDIALNFTGPCLWTCENCAKSLKNIEPLCVRYTMARDFFNVVASTYRGYSNSTDLPSEWFDLSMRRMSAENLELQDDRIYDSVPGTRNRSSRDGLSEPHFETRFH